MKEQSLSFLVQTLRWQRSVWSFLWSQACSVLLFRHSGEITTKVFRFLSTVRNRSTHFAESLLIVMQNIMYSVTRHFETSESSYLTLNVHFE